MAKFPPHIRWPAAIIALLMLNIGVSVATFFAAGSDGGSQVVEDYYSKAAAWDEHMAEAADSEALGWEADVQLDSDVDLADGLRRVRVTVTDRSGVPVSDLSGVVRLFRPQWSKATATLPLLDVKESPGVYEQLVPINGAGLWDIAIDVQRDSVRFATRKRVEWLP